VPETPEGVGDLGRFLVAIRNQRPPIMTKVGLTLSAMGMGAEARDELSDICRVDRIDAPATDCDNGQRTEDGVDVTPFEPEFAQVPPREQRVRCL